MILALALMFAAADGPPAMKSGALTAMCEAGMSGEEDSAVRCKRYIASVAKTLTTDADASGCLSQPEFDPDEAVWAYMDWVGSNPQDGDADASIGVMSALVGKWPCGWSDMASS